MSSPRQNLLEEAIRLVTKERGQLYGPPEQDFRRTAAMWTAVFEDLLKPDVEFLPHHVAMGMMCLKLSRLSRSPEHRDSWVDSAGYSACGHQCVAVEIEEGELGNS